MRHHPIRFCRNNLLSFLIASVVLSALPLPRVVKAQDDADGAGAIIRNKASAADVGLPIYPGAKPHPDKDSSSPAAKLGLWGGGSFFKLTVLKMESADSMDKIAAFYKKALSQYGPVLDCTHPPAASAPAAKADSKTLTCGDDKADRGGSLFKSGTREKQHMVAIEPNGQGTIFTLLNLAAWNAK